MKESCYIFLLLLMLSLVAGCGEDTPLAPSDGNPDTTAADTTGSRLPLLIPLVQGARWEYSYRYLWQAYRQGTLEVPYDHYERDTLTGGYVLEVLEESRLSSESVSYLVQATTSDDSGEVLASQQFDMLYRDGQLWHKHVSETEYHYTTNGKFQAGGSINIEIFIPPVGQAHEAETSVSGIGYVLGNGSQTSNGFSYGSYPEFSAILDSRGLISLQHYRHNGSYNFPAHFWKTVTLSSYRPGTAP